MTNKFYRTETINAQKWEEIIRAMKQDLETLKTSKPAKEELRKYVADLLAEARPLETDPEMKFFGLWHMFTSLLTLRRQFSSKHVCCIPSSLEQLSLKKRCVPVCWLAPGETSTDLAPAT